MSNLSNLSNVRGAKRRPTINVILAVTDDLIIGVDGKMPWHLPSDLVYFKKVTIGHTVIMGRKTFESIGSKPLPGRQNIVVSNSLKQDFSIPNLAVCRNLSEALEVCAMTHREQAFVIGGKALYEEALPKADAVHVTYVHAHAVDHQAISDGAEVTRLNKMDLDDLRLAEVYAYGTYQLHVYVKDE